MSAPKAPEKHTKCDKCGALLSSADQEANRLIHASDTTKKPASEQRYLCKNCRVKLEQNTAQEPLVPVGHDFSRAFDNDIDNKQGGKEKSTSDKAK
ncbi:MAG: hypothetical protein L6R36_007706 [Xanthoria steineri]|nr:MAG: hypothetical protein L6R36_007706 [Xanthoria steineri]